MIVTVKIMRLEAPYSTLAAAEAASQLMQQQSLYTCVVGLA